MNRDLISKRTRNEFREFLVGWTLREIETEFDSADMACDKSHAPEVSGQRRSLVEQYYNALDFTKPDDVRRLLTAYASILEKAESTFPTAVGGEEVCRSITRLKAQLSKDGFAFRDGKITAAAAGARVVFESRQSVTAITRRAIFDELTVRQVAWWGSLSEPDFLNRVFDLSGLPSFDPRFTTMAGDIRQHRENNLDWDDSWVFSDSRLNLLHASDEVFLRFLREIVHPVVRPDSNEARALVETINTHLSADGWRMVEDGVMSGRPLFSSRRRPSGTVVLPDPAHTTEVLSDEYVRELSDKCDFRLTSNDLEGAVTVARTLLEAVLSELEVRLSGTRGDHKGDLPKQFKGVTKLLRMDDQRPDLDDRFKDVVRGLVMVANGLAPLRNKMSDGHARVRKPAPHHARLVVNASKTISAFLVESYLFQRDHGLLSSVSTNLGQKV